MGGQLVSGRFWRAASPIRDSGSPCRVHSGQWLHYDTHRLRPYAKLRPHSSSQVTPPDKLPRLRDLLRSRLELPQCTSPSIQYPTAHHFAGSADHLYSQSKANSGEVSLDLRQPRRWSASSIPALPDIFRAILFGHRSTPWPGDLECGPGSVQGGRVDADQTDPHARILFRLRSPHETGRGKAPASACSQQRQLPIKWLACCSTGDQRSVGTEVRSTYQVLRIHG